MKAGMREKMLEREKDYGGKSENRAWMSTSRYRFHVDFLFILFITLFFRLFGGSIHRLICLEWI